MTSSTIGRMSGRGCRLHGAQTWRQFFQTSKDTYSFYNTDKKVGLKEIKWLILGSEAEEWQGWASDPSVSRSTATRSCFATPAVDSQL